jgi:type II secretory pathway pseudopilin PulG
MYLGGQGGQRGYAMAAVLVAVAVMGIVMSALLPVWRHQSQREKEAELLFRMQQYALAIDLYRAKNNNQFPPSIDALVQGKYLRKKYKDPMTGDDFQPLFQGQQPTGGGRGQGAPQAGGIIGVVSKSKETAIRNQRGATTYNQWQVTAADAPPGPGYPVGARGNRGAGPQSGAPGGQPGGRGNVPPGRGNPGIGGPGRGAPPFGPGVGAPGRGGGPRGGGPGAGGPLTVPGGRRGGG